MAQTTCLVLFGAVVVNKMEKNKNKKHTPMAQTTHLVLFGPFFLFVGLCWPSWLLWVSWAFVGLVWAKEGCHVWQVCGLRWLSLASVGFCGPVLAYVGLWWPSLAAMGLCC